MEWGIMYPECRMPLSVQIWLTACYSGWIRLFREIIDYGMDNIMVIFDIIIILYYTADFFLMQTI